jgi:hypothetical protein
MRWAEFRGPGLANRLQTAIFGDSSGICKTRIQQQQTAAAEFGTFLLKTAMAHMEIRNRPPETSRGNLRSHSLDKKLRQIVTTGASHTKMRSLPSKKDQAMTFYPTSTGSAEGRVRTPCSREPP